MRRLLVVVLAAALGWYLRGVAEEERAQESPAGRPPGPPWV